VLAVDRFAIRSLCWRVIDQRIHFAARADELAALSPRADLDPQAIFDYLHFHVIPSPRTIFRGVYRVPPAHVAVFERGSVQMQRYWTPQFIETAQSQFDTLAARFRQHVRDAVAAELDGSKPACFLSGGTDSSTVAGMLAELRGGAAATFSIGFEAEGYDEMQYARIAARHFGTEHHEHYVTPDDLVASIPQVATHYDQPFGNSSALPAYHCARMARASGVGKLLAGDGGDELFGGNSRYAKQRVFGTLRRGLLEPALERSPLGRLPLVRKGRSYIEQAKVPLPDRMQMYNLLLRLGITEVLEPAFLARVDSTDPLRQQRAVWQQVGPSSALNRTLAYDWRYTLAEADLPKVCGTTALAGVAVGFPFLDAALVDFSLTLPTNHKLKGLKLRWFFKEALRGFLPEQIITKKKQGFGLPFGVWALQHQALGQLAADSLHSLGRRGIVRPAFVRPLLEQLLPQHPGYYGEMVWILMMLEQWLRAQADADARLA
jgi:asparagine synthase (glutamine-hydrolysing)